MFHHTTKTGDFAHNLRNQVWAGFWSYDSYSEVIPIPDGTITSGWPVRQWRTFAAGGDLSSLVKHSEAKL